jgi:hypothetical protein
MNLLFDELDTPTPVTYPVRVSMNNHTLSIFSGENYNTVYRSYDLAYLKMTKSKIDPVKCFVLGDTRDAVKKSTVCILPEMLKPD